jgi:hypothetical protein
MKTTHSIRHVAHGARVLSLLFAMLAACVLAPSATFAQAVAWNQRVLSGPSARFAHAMAYDAARGVTVLFGGRPGGGFNADTWELGVSCPIPYVTAQPLPRTVCPSDSTNFTVAATVVGGGALIYSWQCQVAGDSAWVPIVAGLNSFAGVPQFEATGTTTSRVSLRPAVGPGGTRRWPNPG